MSMPKQGDKTDHRCGLVENRRGPHKLQEGEENWCHGCQFYICDDCSLNAGLMGRHDVMDHLDEEDFG